VFREEVINLEIKDFVTYIFNPLVATALVILFIIKLSEKYNLIKRVIIILPLGTIILVGFDIIILKIFKWQ